MEDAELLRDYALNRSQAAFTALVRRHLDLVFATARRTLGGDAHRAHDVAQLVFLELARRAPTLGGQRVLAGWLYTTTRNTAADVVRSERRRVQREQKAQIMAEMTRDAVRDAEWQALRPAVDEALSLLRRIDREAVILRFLEGRRYPEIGARLALSEDAARLRVERALEKMRETLSRRGIPSTAAALAGALATEAAVAAPIGLADSIAGSVLAVAPAGLFGGATMAGLAHFMTTNKLAAITLGAILSVGTGGVLLQQRAQARLIRAAAAQRLEVAETVKLAQENRELADTLENRRALNAKNAARAAKLAEGPSVKERVAALQAQLAAKVAKGKLNGEGPEVSAASREVLSRLKPLIDQENWSSAIALMADLAADTPEGSPDRLLAVSTLGKIAWQGQDDLARALAAYEQVGEIIDQHPEYFDAKETVDYYTQFEQLNRQIAYKSGKPDQWFASSPP